MTFSVFVIICLVALIVYYAFIALRPEKQTNFRSERHPFKSIEIKVEPPIAVTMGMVTFSPTVVESDKDTSTNTEEVEEDNSINKYNSHSTITNCSLSDLEIKVFYTKEACEAGKQLFSNISL